MKKINYLFLIFLSLSAIISCKEEPKKTEEKSVPDTLATPAKAPKEIPKPAEENKDNEKIKDINLSAHEKNILFYIDSLSLGTKSHKIKEIFSAAKGPFVEGDNKDLGAQGLTEVFVNTIIFGETVFIEFNFKNDSLYSFNYTLNEPNLERSTRIYQTLLNYYSGKLGTHIAERIEEENHYTQSCFWKGPNYYTTLTHNLNSSTISWGFQGTKPE